MRRIVCRVQRAVYFARRRVGDFRTSVAIIFVYSGSHNRNLDSNNLFGLCMLGGGSFLVYPAPREDWPYDDTAGAGRDKRKGVNYMAGVNTDH